MDKKAKKSALLLFTTAVIWGVAFVCQSKGMDYMGPLTFMASRNILAALFLLPLVVASVKKGNIRLRKNILGGIVCGVVLVAADFCQQYGITMTTVGKAGFITTLYIIFTPILGIFVHKKIGLKIWLCAFAAMAGMYLICITDSFSIGRGDTFVFICAVLFAVHILVIDRYVTDKNGVVLSCVQFFTCSAISGVLSLVFEAPKPSQIADGIIPVLYAGLISSGIGYTLQTIGQKGLSPTIAALILSLESVISAVAGYFAYKVGILTTDQTLTLRQIIGCAVVFAAVIAVQLPDINFKRRTVNDKNSLEGLQ